MTPYDIWAEIDLSAISGNIKALKGLIPKKTRFMAVVKANAYGHGAVQVAKAAIGAGADLLGVARLGEAVELRHAGVDSPILILGQSAPQSAAKLIAYNLIQTVCSYESAVEFSTRARALGGQIRVHVKIDTGMGRLGIFCGDAACGTAVDEIRSIYELPGLVCDGIYTHFACADASDKTITVNQFARFTEILESLESGGLHFPCRHAANSAAMIDMPETHLDMVRAGISIYGHFPSEAVDRTRVGLTPAMTVGARIVQLKTVGPGVKISYGWTAQTSSRTTIATVAAGYADGFNRLLSSVGCMTIKGRQVKVIGRVCMDYVMIDIGGPSGIMPGDAVVLFGDPATGAISVEAVARALGTISYEVLTMISGRVPRIHLNG